MSDHIEALFKYIKGKTIEDMTYKIDNLSRVLVIHFTDGDKLAFEPRLTGDVYHVVSNMVLGVLDKNDQVYSDHTLKERVAEMERLEKENRFAGLDLEE
jgi:hypothetical protein